MPSQKRGGLGATTPREGTPLSQEQDVPSVLSRKLKRKRAEDPLLPDNHYPSTDEDNVGSKTRSFTKAGGEAEPPARTAPLPGGGPTLENKRSKPKQKGKPMAGSPMSTGQTSFNQAHETKTQPDLPTTDQPKQLGAFTKSTAPDGQAVVTGASAGPTQTAAKDGEESGGHSHMKRGKSRSKQKNIRKDRRSDDQRPSHLRLGTSEFTGRFLTLETKQRLGLTDDADQLPAQWSIDRKPEAPPTAAAAKVKPKGPSKYKNLRTSVPA